MALDLTKLIEKLDPQPDGQDKTQLRTGVVAAVNLDGTLNVTLSGVVVPNVPRLASVGVIVGDPVQVQVYRGSMLVLGLVASVGAPNLASSAAIGQTAVTSGQDDTTSATFVNMAGTGAVTSITTFQKRYSSSRIKVDIQMSLFSITSTATAEIAVLIDGVDTLVMTVPTTAANARRVVYRTGFVSNVSSGTKTIQGRWRRTAGTGTLRRNTDDWFAMTVTEVS